MKALLSCSLALGVAALAAPAAVVSPPAQPSASAAGHSSNPQFSAGGQHFVFVSAAHNLVTNDDLGLWLDVFVHDLVTSNTVLVSVSTNGTGGANWDANYPSISSNGQFIAFASRASNLVPGDTNDRWDVFVRDLASGTTRLVNSPATTDHQHPIISADGRWVFFEGRSTNAFPVIPGGVVNVMGYDLLLNSLSLVSADTNGLPVNGRCELASVSADGRHAAFLASNPELTGEDPAVRSLFVRDMQTGVTTWEGYVPGVTEPVIAAQLSENGTLAVLLTAGVSNAVVRRQLGFGSQVLGLFATNGVLSINADATRVAYESDGYARLWVYDSGGASYPFPIFQTNRTANPVLSRDGQALVFLEATSPAASQWQIHRWTTPTNFTPVSLTPTGSLSSGDFLFSPLAVNGDGSRVAFHTLANDLVADDRNGASDIFVRDMNAGATALISRAAPSRPPATTFAHSFLGPNSVSADGRFVVSTRYDDPSAWRDTNGLLDVFVSDRLLGTSHALSVDNNLFVPEVGGPPTYPPNTNAYSGPIISADGTTVAAMRKGSLSIPLSIHWARSSNGLFSSGMTVAHRTDNPSAPGTGSGSFSLSSLSADGRSIVFTTTSQDYLFTNGTDGSSLPKVILRRTAPSSNGLHTGANYLVSVNPSGFGGNGASSNGIISPDSRWVIFESVATDLVPGTPTGKLLLYARDLWSNTTHWVNPPQFPTDPNHVLPGQARFSGNSHRVTYVDGDATLIPFILAMHDLSARTNTYCPAYETPDNPSVDFDGHYIVFNVRPFETNIKQARVWDTWSNTVAPLSVGPTGATANDTVGSPFISGGGRYAVFQSWANNLITTDTNRVNDIFVRDRVLGVTMLVSANAQGRPGNGPSTRPVMAANGRTVVFQSHASDLVTGDYNDKRDLFVVTLGGVDSEPDGMDDDWEMAYFETLARDGTLDWDGDGATDLAEFLAGTDPKNSGSIFRVITVAPAGGGGRLLLWSGNPARSYRAEYKDGLTAPGWTALTGGITWNGTTASTLDTTAGSATNRFYRVLRLP